MRAFALTIPAHSTGRYVDLDWDAVLAEYHDEVVKRRADSKSKDSKSKRSKSKR
jgi:hypothetical protein